MTCREHHWQLRYRDGWIVEQCRTCTIIRRIQSLRETRCKCYSNPCPHNRRPTWGPTMAEAGACG